LPPRLDHVQAVELLAARLARRATYRGKPPVDRRQPAAEILDAAGFGAAEPQHALTASSASFIEQHPVRDGAQMRAVLLEPLGHPIVVAHGHNPSAGCLIV